VPAGQSSSALTYVHDLHPTILKLAGVQPTPAAHTADLAPLWQGQQAAVCDSVFMGFSGQIRSIPDERRNTMHCQALGSVFQLTFQQLAMLGEAAVDALPPTAKRTGL
jgi:hypothetical protein